MLLFFKSTNKNGGWQETITLAYAHNGARYHSSSHQCQEVQYSQTLMAKTGEEQSGEEQSVIKQMSKFDVGYNSTDKNYCAVVSLKALAAWTGP